MFMLVSWFGLTLPLLNAADWFQIGRAVQQECRDRKSGSAGMPRPISYAVFCLKKKDQHTAKSLVYSPFDSTPSCRHRLSTRVFHSQTALTRVQSRTQRHKHTAKN